MKYRPNKRDIACATAGGIVGGTCLALARAFYANGGSLEVADPLVWLGVLGAIVVAAICFFAGFALHDVVLRRDALQRFSHVVRTARPRTRRIILLALAALLWIPAFLAFYPGNYSSDAPLQVTILLNDGIVDLHWPAVHTLLLSGVIVLGNTLLGSYDAGVSLFVACQALLLAFSLAHAADRLVQWKAPVWIVAVLWLFAVLNPAIQAYAFTTAKDSLFAAFFLLSLACFADVLMRLQAQGSCKPASLVPFALSALAMCLLRKQGLVVLAIMVVLVAVVLRRRACIVLAASVCCVFAGYFVIGALVDATAVVRSDSAREVLSVPSQQIVRTYMLDHDALSVDDIRAITRYYDEGQLEAGRTSAHPWEGMPNIGSYYDTETGAGYLEPISDPAKGALVEHAYASDRGGYIGTWLSLGAAHPQAYADAFLWGCAGYVYPSSAVNNRWTGLSPFNEFGVVIDAGGEDNQVSDYNESSLFPAYRTWLVAASQDLFAGHRLLTLWVHPALAFYLLLGAFMLAVRNRQRTVALVLLMPAVYGLSLAFGPVMCVRYAIPLMLCIPFAAALPFCQALKEPLEP